MMRVTTTVEHDGRRFTVRSTLGDDCRLAMLQAFVRTAVDQIGGEVNPDAREVADWLTEEVGRTSTRAVSQLLRQLVYAGDLTRQRVGNSWYYAPAPAQQVMIAAISAPPRRRERIPPASHTSAGVQTARQVAAPSHAAGVQVGNVAADQPSAPPDASEMQVRCTVADTPSAPPDASEMQVRCTVADTPSAPPDASEMQAGCTVADTPSAPPDAGGTQAGCTVANPVANASDAPSRARAPAGRVKEINIKPRPAGIPEVRETPAAKPTDPPNPDVATDRPGCTISTCYCPFIPGIKHRCTGLGGQVIAGRVMRDRCPKHTAPLRESTKFSAVAAGGGFKHCPSTTEGGCTFLAHDMKGVLIQPDDPRGEVANDEYRDLLANGGRPPLLLP